MIKKFIAFSLIILSSSYACVGRHYDSQGRLHITASGSDGNYDRIVQDFDTPSTRIAQKKGSPKKSSSDQTATREEHIQHIVKELQQATRDLQQLTQK